MPRAQEIRLSTGAFVYTGNRKRDNCRAGLVPSERVGMRRLGGPEGG